MLGRSRGKIIRSGRKSEKAGGSYAQKVAVRWGGECDSGHKPSLAMCEGSSGTIGAPAGCSSLHQQPLVLILGEKPLSGYNQIQVGVYIYMVSCPCSVLGGKRLHYHKEYVFIPVHKYYLL